MQQYFIEQAASYAEAERKAREKYGENLTILMHESVKIPGGFLKLFSREGVKLTGIIPSRRPQFYKEQPAAKETLAAVPAARPPAQQVKALDFAEAKEIGRASCRERVWS
jgi:flagellar biosynthesis GTPase FlhF